MTLEALVLLIAGALLSLVQELLDWWIPWLGTQPEVIKRLITFGFNLVAAAVVYGIACAGLLSLLLAELTLACDQSGILTMLGILIALLTGGQTIHKIVRFSPNRAAKVKAK